MLSMNRNTITTMVGVALALAVAYYLYKEMRSTRTEIDEMNKALAALQSVRREDRRVVVAQTPQAQPQATQVAQPEETATEPAVSAE